ncbi:DegV family EDD domain-containing protein [Patescibacteria group bacterium]|nr:DegV family EDD domain-containing protein [Patescibacteria group bacterium]
MSDKKPLGLVVGETADLPQSFTQKNGIEVVQFEVNFPEDISDRNPRKNFYARMRQGEIPKTAQPPVGQYLKAFRAALDKFDQILVIIMTGDLSGALQSSQQAKRRMPEEEQAKVHIIDSRLASVAEGLVCWKAQELIKAGKDTIEIVGYLESIKKAEELIAEGKNPEQILGFEPLEIGSLGLLESAKWLEIGGRISHADAVKAEIAKKIGMRAAITLKHGKVEGVGKKGVKFSPRGVVASLLGEIKRARQQLGPDMKIAIAHADVSKKQLQKLIMGIRDMRVELLFVSEITPVLGTYSGPGTILIAWI